MLLFNKSNYTYSRPGPTTKKNCVFTACRLQQIGHILNQALNIILVNLVLFTTALSLSGCSKQEELQQRKQTLEQFCTSVAQHILDRNPDTMRESLSTLLHEQLTDQSREKLEDSKVIPDSPITVMRETAESKDAHRSNKIDVLIVRPLTPVEKDPVTYKVTVKDITLINDKPANDKTYSFTIVCKLTPDMDNFPRVLDVAGLGKSPGQNSNSAPTKKRHRH